MASLRQELFRGGVYKPTLGKVARTLTMLAIGLISCAGAATWYFGMASWGAMTQSIGTLLIAGCGCWFGFRVTNWMPFADFLVDVEAEMMKISWPGKTELYLSTIVVLVLMALLACILYVFDSFWSKVFHEFLKLI